MSLLFPAAGASQDLARIAEGDVAVCLGPILTSSTYPLACLSPTGIARLIRREASRLDVATPGAPSLFVYFRRQDDALLDLDYANCRTELVRVSEASVQVGPFAGSLARVRVLSRARDWAPYDPLVLTVDIGRHDRAAAAAALIPFGLSPQIAITVGGGAKRGRRAPGVDTGLTDTSRISLSVPVSVAAAEWWVTDHVPARSAPLATGDFVVVRSPDGRVIAYRAVARMSRKWAAGSPDGVWILRREFSSSVVAAWPHGPLAARGAAAGRGPAWGAHRLAVHHLRVTGGGSSPDPQRRRDDD